MAVTVASFRAAFPEFTEAPADAVVSRALADAAHIVDLSASSSDLSDRALSYMAAHIITQDPRGERLGLSNQAKASITQANVQKGGHLIRGTSPYLESYERLLVASVVPLVSV